MVSGISSTPIILPNLIRLQHGAGKLSYPVRSDQRVFARFKHITTVPSSTGDGGVSVYKLRVLDNLIERLIGKQSAGTSELAISNDNIDTLISRIGSEVAHRESSSLNVSAFRGFSPGRYAAGIMPEMGSILNTFA